MRQSSHVTEQLQAFEWRSVDPGRVHVNGPSAFFFAGLVQLSISNIQADPACLETVPIVVKNLKLFVWDVIDETFSLFQKNLHQD